MKVVPEEVWKPGLERARRNLNRILDIQHQAEDIMMDRPYKMHGLLSLLLGECTDLLEVLAADETGEGSAAGRIRKRIEELFGGKKDVISEIDPAGCLRERIEALKARFTHREVEIVTDLEEGAPFIRIPSDVLQKVVDGLIRNAVENTPDEGKIEVNARKRGKGIELVVHDYGVGITEGNQRRIFEGFFVARDTIAL
jgi:signal transduction histidine kinase